MSRDEQVADLLLAWDEERALGNELTAEELCQGAPTLVDDVRQAIRELKQTDWLFAADDTEADFPQLPTKFVHDESDEDSISYGELSRELVGLKLVSRSQLDEIESNLTAIGVSPVLAALQEHELITAFQVKRILKGNAHRLIVGDYVILERIGIGGMGEVFKARHRTMDRIVALKTLPKWLVDSEGAVQRFQREVKAVAKLDHRNIVTAFDAGQSGSVHFLVMQYVEGQDLASLVQEQGTVNAAVAISAIRQTATALQYAHEQGVVHRDVKPSNLLVDGNGAIKVLDLGLARLLEHESIEADASITKDGATIGTVGYMSPEQALDTRSADERTDIYGLGCTFYFLLHGEPPFSREEIVKSLVSKETQEAPVLFSEPFEGSDSLQAIFAKMVENDPDDRYESMTELIDALDQCEVLEGQEAMPVAVATHAAVDTQVISQRDYDTERDVPEPVSAPRKPAVASGSGTWLGVLGLLGLFVLAGVIVIKITTKDGKSTEIQVPDGATLQITSSESGDAKVDSPAKSEKVIPAPPKKTKPRVSGKKAKLSPTLADVPFKAAQARQLQEEWAAHLGVPRQYENSIGMKFELIPPGAFTMGTDAEVLKKLVNETKSRSTESQLFLIRAMEKESPQRPVTIRQPFYIGIHEVTQSEYQAITGNNPSQFSDDTGGGSLPVENLTWIDALRFCEGLSKQESMDSPYTIKKEGESRRFNRRGAGYRLPLEIEWEFACRAGTTTQYWFGDHHKDLLTAAWFGENSEGKTHPVGQLAPNPFGLYDVYGNVAEYCEDRMRSLETEDPQDRTRPLAEGWAICCKGDRWCGSRFVTRSASRTSKNTPYNAKTLGFRVVLDVDAVRNKIGNTVK